MRETYWEGAVVTEEPSESPSHSPRGGGEERARWCSIESKMKAMNHMGETGPRWAAVGGSWHNGRGLAGEPKKGCC